jgi:hypothetical protein
MVEVALEDLYFRESETVALGANVLGDVLEVTAKDTDGGRDTVEGAVLGPSLGALSPPMNKSYIHNMT